MKTKKIILILLIIILILFLGIKLMKLNEFHDEGVIGNKNTEWIMQNQSSLYVSSNEYGTHILNNGSNITGIFANKQFTDKDTFDWSNYVLDVDIIDINGTVYFQNLDKFNNHATKNNLELNLTNNSHVKIINNGKTQQFYANGKQITPPFNFKMDNSRVGFVLTGNSSFTYKNFTIKSL